MKAYALNRTKFLDSAELAELHRRLDNISDSRTSTLIRLALGTGARATELLNIKRIDIFMNDRSVLIRGLKGSNDREIPLTDALFDAVQGQLATHKDDNLFPFGYTTLMNTWHAVRPVKKKFHSLRHTFAIEVYKRTKDIKLVQMALGHKNLKNTEIYMDFLYSQNEMRKLLCG